MMMERFIQPTNDPLALVSNASVQKYPTQSSMSPQSSNNHHPDDNFSQDSGMFFTDNLIEKVLDEEQLLFLAGEQVTNFDDDVDDPTKKDLALNVDHIFKADQCDAFDSEFTTPNIQTNVYDHLDEYHEVHEMQNDVQHNYVVDYDAEYASDSNIILYNQYMEDNEEHVVQSNVSSVAILKH
ncbi:hypothetical protein Tco_0340326 [Tanacetum coccineum]